METVRNPARGAWPKLCERPGGGFEALEKTVGEVLRAVKEGGDRALRSFTAKFDGVELEGLEVSPGDLKAAAAGVPEDLKNAILFAKKNVEAFHRGQREKTRRLETVPGVVCWRESVPIESVGLYIPGGTAPLFSTVLMLAVPAKLAGCRQIVLCSPPSKEGCLPAAICYTAWLLGIERVFRVGGAQAIAAMAYGTESIPRVDKIFGPGNRYVTCAKQLVAARGEVAIDLPAGPTELLVVADEACVPAFVAADLLSQAEHGPDSQVVLVTTTEAILPEIERELQVQCARLPRREVAEQALKGSRIVVVKNLEEGMAFSNFYAPEHLILAVKDPAACAKAVRSAGSVFLGNFAPEAVGDYASGTNHTLPTSGAARCYSGVSLDSFIKKITFQELTPAGLDAIGPAVEAIAGAEELSAHKNAVALRRRSLAAGDLKREFKLDQVLRSHLQTLTPYSSARDDFSGQASVWLDANENPFGSASGAHWNRYPDPHQRKLKARIAAVKGVLPDQVFLGNGSDEVIDLLIRAFCEPVRDKILIMPPTYGMYEVAAEVNEVGVVSAPLTREFQIDLAAVLEALDPEIKLIFICSPNNPTANCPDTGKIVEVIRGFPGVVVLDEAYADFAGQKSLLPRLADFPNLVISQTFSKAWGMAGARLGMAFAAKEIVNALDRMKAPYNVSSLTQEAAMASLEQAEQKDEMVRVLIEERQRLSLELEKLPFVKQVYPSDANFLLAQVTNAKRLYSDLLKQGIVVRDRSNVLHCEECVRITVGTPEENAKLIKVCRDLYPNG